MSLAFIIPGAQYVDMVGLSRPDPEEPADECPERNDPIDESHTPEGVEQPDDSSAFWVWRCSECGTVFESYETEQEYLSNEYPEIHHGGN